MQETMARIEIVTRMLKDIMPKDIVINAWVGTSLPNPALPVAVLMNSVSADFDELLEKEIVARRVQVKACRTQGFRDTMLGSIGY